MESVAFILAGLSAVAAGVLLKADSQRKAAQPSDGEPRDDAHAPVFDDATEPSDAAGHGRPAGHEDVAGDDAGDYADPRVGDPDSAPAVDDQYGAGRYGAGRYGAPAGFDAPDVLDTEESSYPGARDECDGAARGAAVTSAGSASDVPETGVHPDEDHGEVADAARAARFAATDTAAADTAAAAVDGAAGDSAAAGEHAATPEREDEGSAAAAAARDSLDAAYDSLGHAGQVEAPTQQSTPAGGAHLGFSLRLPGAARRQRKRWATTRGMQAQRQAEELSDAWTRGEAASGAIPRDVFSGVYADYPLYLCELGQSLVLALHRGGVSPVAVEFYPPGREQFSDDLVEVGVYEGWNIAGSEAGPVERFIDARVHRALHDMPSAVEFFWLEEDWLVAQFARTSSPDAWDDALDAMVYLADASRVLPPVPSAELALDTAELDPSRSMPHPLEPTAEDEPEPVAAPHLSVVPDPTQNPPVYRPETPAELPSRTHEVRHGTVAREKVGADAVAPIADGEPQEPANSYQGTRAVRDFAEGPSIFDDLTIELGTNPLRDMPGEDADIPPRASSRGDFGEVDPADRERD